LFESLNPNAEYPEILTSYLYGSGPEFHLSHLLSRAPNFQQELDVTLSGDIIDKINELDISEVFYLMRDYILRRKMKSQHSGKW
jgi:hypothetical protein